MRRRSESPGRRWSGSTRRRGKRESGGASGPCERRLRLWRPRSRWSERGSTRRRSILARRRSLLGAANPLLGAAALFLSVAVLFLCGVVALFLRAADPLLGEALLLDAAAHSLGAAAFPPWRGNAPSSARRRSSSSWRRSSARRRSSSSWRRCFSAAWWRSSCARRIPSSARRPSSTRRCSILAWRRSGGASGSAGGGSARRGRT